MQNHAAGLMRWIFGYRAYDSEDMGSHVDYRFSTLKKLIMNLIRSLANTTVWLPVSQNSYNKAIFWHIVHPLLCGGHGLRGQGGIPDLPVRGDGRLPQVRPRSRRL